MLQCGRISGHQHRFHAPRSPHAAAAETLPRFRAQGAVANKEAGSFDPVTEADREAERAIRALIIGGISRSRHSGRGASAARTSPARHVWVIDPIDGTRAFISGLPVWGTLVGLTVDGDAVAGLMAQPFTGELFYANASGSHYEGPGGPRKLATRKTTKLDEATLFTTTPALFKGEARDRLRPVREAGPARPLRHRLLCLRHDRGRAASTSSPIPD